MSKDRIEKEVKYPLDPISYLRHYPFSSFFPILKLARSCGSFGVDMDAGYWLPLSDPLPHLSHIL